MRTSDVSAALKLNITQTWIADGVSIDSRTTKAKNLFIAIKGENFDGHNFINDAASKGAVAAIVSTKVAANIPTIIVEDTLQALQALALYKRKKSKAKVIAITGSVGKTTTKEIVHKLLSCYGNSYRSPGNHNNHIGLPLSLLNAPPEADYLILEMGMNHSGEIATLSKIAQPDISIITTIGSAHLEHFSSTQEIAEAKAEIFNGTYGTVILNRDNGFYNYLYKLIPQHPNIHTILTVGFHPKAHFSLTACHENKIEALINQEEKITYSFPTLYKHFALSTLFALAVTKSLKLDFRQWLSTLGDLNLQQGRCNIKVVNGISVIDDTYNSNPMSVESGLKLLSYFQGRKVAILGDMLDLGNSSKELHIKLVNIIIACKIDLVFTVGNNMKVLYKHLPNQLKGNHFNNSKEVAITQRFFAGDTILVKGSRGMKMEIVVKNLLSSYA